MLEKVLADTTCNIDIGVAWCTNAKNSLQNVHGFSPYQLLAKVRTLRESDVPWLIMLVDPIVLNIVFW